VTATPIESSYLLAKQRYAELGVDTEAALKRLEGIAISMHCWQGDDCAGYESTGPLTGGIMATGNYPGRARTADELRADAAKAMKLIPGQQRFSLHAIYLEHGGKPVERNDITPSHFKGWMDWAAEQGISLDFNSTFYSHPKSADGFTLSSRDEGIRRFWVEHGIACRKIGEAMGRRQGNPCIHNVWIPDGMKDVTIDRKGPREILTKSLDEMFA
jgi:L-rhamnose isomerase